MDERGRELVHYVILAVLIFLIVTLEEVGFAGMEAIQQLLILFISLLVIDKILHSLLDI